MSETIRDPVNDVPWTLLLTFGLVVLVIFFLRNLSLMALTLSLGFVAADAIVMLENIVRHVEMGKKPMHA